MKKVYILSNNVNMEKTLLLRLFSRINTIRSYLGTLDDAIQVEQTHIMPISYNAVYSQNFE